MDRFVGEVVAKLAPEDTLLVCADHGFQTFRRQVDMNAWLAHEGYLVLGEGTTLADGGTPLMYVDWSRTKAYALGLGMIFLNLQGREAQGTVGPDKAPALLEEIRGKLLALKDGDKRAVHDVYVMSKIHSGPYLGDECDLMVGFEAGWRVAWNTTLGNIGLVDAPDKNSVVPGAVFTDNNSTWSGDHVSVAADLVPGIFFCNRRVEIPAGGVNLLDIAPTALSVVGVAVPKEYDRPALGFR
jgi:predicted AlkP superfamily phosphohydrolase/phosphomutase